MNTEERNKIDNFIELFKNFKQKQQQQKLRGLNDFNLFTTLLKASDEVRLHSRFLNFLLNPNGEHCQGSLFLDLFLEKCGLADFLDTSNTSVFAEYNSIDLYLTDGNNHIIIENKIWAGDQQKQIKRYIETIKEENKDINLTENLVVIYLSLDREEPTDYSLYNSITEKQNGFYVENGFLVAIKDGLKTVEKYKFKSINYNNQIKKWLKASLQEVGNITNLSFAITQYQEVVERLDGTYKNKIMSFKEYLKYENKNKYNKLELMKTMKEISDEYPDFRKETIKSFLEQAMKNLKEKFEDHKWQVVDKEISGGKQYESFIIQQAENANFVFRFEFEKKDFYESIWGIFSIDAYKNEENKKDVKVLRENQSIKEKLKKLKDDKILTRESDLWLKYGLYQNDLWDKIIAEGGVKKAVEGFIKQFMGIFKSCECIIIRCNEILEQKK